MKLNWGFGVFALYTAFVLFMLFMVFKSSQQKVDLVTDDYYQQELAYQEIINYKSNAERLLNGLTYTLNKNEIELFFPSDHDNISGKVQIYRPSNNGYDKNFDIKLDEENRMILNLGSTPLGLYKMMIQWTNDSVGYYIEKDIYLRP